MASIVKRNKSYSVVYYIKDEKGETKQKWETYSTLEDALDRKEQVESPIPIVGLIKQIRTIGDLADEYIELYGKTRWSCRTYAANLALTRTYILPHLGKVKISQATPRAMQHYYKQLTQLPARKSQYKYDSHGLLSQSTIFEIHKLLRNMFNQAVIWNVLSESPVKLLSVKQPKDRQKKILTPQQVIVALSMCNNDLLSIAIKLAYICSLRKGELLGLC